MVNDIRPASNPNRPLLSLPTPPQWLPTTIPNMGAVLGHIKEGVTMHDSMHDGPNYQIRCYPAQVAAVVYESDLPRDNDRSALPRAKTFDGQAFNMLARYIGAISPPENIGATGGSDENGDTVQEKVTMVAGAVTWSVPLVMVIPGEKTAPIFTTATTTDKPVTGPVSHRYVKFLLPSKYSSTALAPIPTNSAVKLELMSAGRCDAVLALSGRLKLGVIHRKATTFSATLENDGINVTGQCTLQGRCSRVVLPWRRRLELHVSVDPQSYS